MIIQGVVQAPTCSQTKKVHLMKIIRPKIQTYNPKSFIVRRIKWVIHYQTAWAPTETSSTSTITRPWECANRLLASIKARCPADFKRRCTTVRRRLDPTTEMSFFHLLINWITPQSTCKSILIWMLMLLARQSSNRASRPHKCLTTKIRSEQLHSRVVLTHLRTKTSWICGAFRTSKNSRLSHSSRSTTKCQRRPSSITNTTARWWTTVTPNNQNTKRIHRA